MRFVSSAGIRSGGGGEGERQKTFFCLSGGSDCCLDGKKSTIGIFLDDFGDRCIT